METCEKCGNEKNACTCPIEQQPAEIPATIPAEPAPAETQTAGAPADPLAGIGEAFTAAWPQPIEHFVQQVNADAEQEAEAETLAENGGDLRFLRDSNGHYFDPRFCDGRIDPSTGMPKKSAKGMWLLKRGCSRKQLSKKAPKDAAPADVLTGNLDAERAALEEARRRADANATATAQFIDMWAWIGIEVATGTGADAPTKAQGIQALKDWLLTLKNAPTLPPWAVPVMIYGNAFRIRFAAEKAAPRRQALREKMVLLWYRLTRREKPKTPKEEGQGRAAA